MTLKKLLYLILAAGISTGAFAQDTLAAADTAGGGGMQVPRPVPPPFIFKPTIGLGIGVLSYYGDLYDKHFISPQVSRIGYELSISQELTPYLRFGFYSMFGKLQANERLVYRNLNIQSEIRTGGVHLEYNFAHLLRDSATVLPWITAGFESFEFLSKTDLFDKSFNRYYYWSDGSIMNMDENDPNAAFASPLQRDYSFESDVREQNADGFGKYAERSWAVPVGAGVLFKLTPKWEAKVGTTMHFSFTDYIDGVTESSLGNRAGNSKNDNFMFTSLSLRYNFAPPKGKVDSLGNDWYEDVDFLALDNDDYDQDGVPDMKDSCGETPRGAKVDIRGCPLDDDSDLVPDYRDKEDHSAGPWVNEQGITLTDSMILLSYEMYMDSTGKFAQRVILPVAGKSYIGPPPSDPRKYTVSVGTYKSGLPNDVMMKFLSIGDIRSTYLPDSSTIYLVGKFDDLRQAEKRRKTLIQQGLTMATIVYEGPDGSFREVKDVFTNQDPKDPLAVNNPKDPSGNNPKDPSGNNPKDPSGNNPKDPSGNNPKDPSGNNPKDPSGNNPKDPSGNNPKDPSGNNPKDPSGNNPKDPSGNNPKDPSGNNPKDPSGNNPKDPIVNNNPKDPGNSVVPGDGELVFRVQLGAFRKRLSKSVFADVPDLIELKGEDGLYRYMTGSLKTFDDAAGHKINMLVKGYKGAFIVAFKDGKRVPLTDAGAIIMKSEPEKQDTAASSNVVSKNLVSFKVQLGAFKESPPEDIAARLRSIQGVEQATTSAGLTRYTVGNSNNYEEITNLKRRMRESGFPDAFVIAFFKGEPISIQEALELLK